ILGEDTCGTRTALDEDAETRPTAESLDADGSRPCVGVEETRRLNPGRENVEQRLPHPVRGGASGRAFGCPQATALQFAGDYSHAFTPAGGTRIAARGVV